MPFIIFERSANYSKLFQFQRKMIDSDGCHHYRRPLLVLTEHDLFAFGANVLGISFSLACARTSEASEYVRTYAKCVCVCVYVRSVCGPGRRCNWYARWEMWNERSTTNGIWNCGRQMKEQHNNNNRNQQQNKSLANGQNRIMIIYVNITLNDYCY